MPALCVGMTTASAFFIHERVNGVDGQGGRDASITDSDAWCCISIYPPELPAAVFALQRQ